MVTTHSSSRTMRLSLHPGLPLPASKTNMRFSRRACFVAGSYVSGSVSRKSRDWFPMLIDLLEKLSKCSKKMAVSRLNFSRWVLKWQNGPPVFGPCCFYGFWSDQLWCHCTGMSEFRIAHLQCSTMLCHNMPGRRRDSAIISINPTEHSSKDQVSLRCRDLTA